MGRRSIAVTSLVAVALVLAACSAVSGLDGLTFDATTTSGVGGTTTSASKASGSGGQHTASSSGASGGAGGQAAAVRIPCFDPMTKNCPAGQICCVDRAAADDHCDECADPQSECGADLTGCDLPTSYNRIACHTDDDCAAAGKVCCVLTDGQGQVTGIGCLTSCDMTMTFPVCDADQTCAGGGTCNLVGYAGYGVCQ